MQGKCRNENVFITASHQHQQSRNEFVQAYQKMNGKYKHKMIPKEAL